MSARSGAALALAALLAAFACWTIVPAPTMWTLPLAVGVPEIAPFALACALPPALLASWLAHGRTRIAVRVLSAVTLACLLWPIVAAPFAGAAADGALDAAGFAPARAHTPVAVETIRDVPVALRAGGSLALDVYRPRGTRTVPLVVAIYGGAWAFGSRADLAPLARWYAARGYAVAVIDYRHAAQFHFPAQRDDVEDALRAIAAHARSWHVDPRRVALFGRSAGAELALIAAERAQPLHVAAVVGYYAPIDLTGGWNEPPRPDPAGVRQILNAYLGGPPVAARASAYRAASPQDGAHRGMPPALLIAGDRDELVRIGFQRAFVQRLRALDDPVVAIELPWANHAFDAVDGLGAAIARRATLRFLDATLEVAR